jgi:hypothetical protein
MSVLKNRLKAVEVKLKPIQQGVKVRAFSVVDYDDELQLLGYRCNGLLQNRNDGELLADFTTRAQSIFIAQNSEKFCIFLHPIYNRD